MFFRSKTEPATTPQQTPAASPVQPLPPMMRMPDMTPGAQPGAGPGQTAGAELSEEQKARAAAARRATAAFGQVMALVMRSPQHQTVTVGDLRTVVAPLVMAGQYALAGRRFREGGFARPVAAVLWARVSEAVDQRLQASTSGQLHLARDEISSGDIIWIVDVLGDPASIQSMLRRLGETQWKGQAIKVRTMGPDQVMQVRTLGPF